MQPHDDPPVNSKAYVHLRLKVVNIELKRQLKGPLDSAADLIALQERIEQLRLLAIMLAGAEGEGVAAPAAQKKVVRGLRLVVNNPEPTAA